MVTPTTTETEPLKDLTGFQRDLLAAIVSFDERASGQQVKDRLEEDYGVVNHGRLYPNLDELVEAGYVRKGTIDRRTNSYETTAAGAEALRLNAMHQLKALE